MKKIIISDKFKEILMQDKYKVILTDFYKYSPESEFLLKKIEHKKNKLSQEYYALPTAFLYDKNRRYLGFKTNYYAGYKTLRELVMAGDIIEENKIIEAIYTFLTELKNIGITYYDIHDKNFLINEVCDLVALDLDGAYPKLSIEREVYQVYNFVDLIIELYFFKENISPGLFLESLLYFINLEEYYSKEVVEYINLVNRCAVEIIDEDPRILLREFNDYDKRQRIIKKMRGI